MGNLDKSKWIFVTEEMTTNLINTITEEATRRALAYGQVMTAITQLKDHILLAPLLKRPDWIERLRTLKAELTKAADLYHTELLRQPWKVLKMEFPADYIEVFGAAVQIIKSSVDIVIEEPNQLPQLRQRLTETPLDNDFIKMIDRAKKRNRPGAVSKAQQKAIGNAVIDLQNRHAGITVRGAAERERARLEDEENVYLSAETIIKYFYAVQRDE